MKRGEKDEKNSKSNEMNENDRNSESKEVNKNDRNSESKEGNKNDRNSEYEEVNKIDRSSESNGVNKNDRNSESKEEEIEEEMDNGSTIKNQWQDLFDKKKAQHKSVKVKRKTIAPKICRFYLKGRCRMGNLCNFDHPSDCFITNGKITKNLGPMSVYVYEDETHDGEFVNIYSNNETENTEDPINIDIVAVNENQNHFLERGVKGQNRRKLKRSQLQIHLEKERDKFRLLIWITENY